MNLARNPARRLARNQPPLLRQFWLHRTLLQGRQHGSSEAAGEEQTNLTERGEPAPDDQT